MYISLRYEGKIELGIVCNTLTSIQRMKNIFSDFHSQDKDYYINASIILGYILNPKTVSHPKFQSLNGTNSFHFSKEEKRVG